MDKDQLRKTVNGSGFPLQIAIEAQIKNQKSKHRWRVLFSEHSWVNTNTDSGGFIDLILEHEDHNAILIVECKRVQNTHWIFLQEQVNPKSRRHIKPWITEESGGKLQKFGWFDTAVDPESPESGFCVVPGQDSKSRPMLERLASEVIESTEGFAVEDHYLHKGYLDYARYYFSAIVTTADLMVCNFDPKSVAIETGEIDEALFTNVPYIRFRKQLSSYKMPEASWKELTAHEIARQKENTVFIINASALVDFLSEFFD